MHNRAAWPAPASVASVASVASAAPSSSSCSPRCAAPCSRTRSRSSGFRRARTSSSTSRIRILHPGVEQSFETGGVVACSYADAALAEGEGEGEGGRSFTKTNTQDVNVDEPDFVKNNGDVIFVLRRGAMVILAAWPPDDMHVLSRTTISGTPFTMLFDDDDKTAMVVSHFFGDKVQTLVKIYDVRDPTAPVELRSTLIDGDFVDARAVNQKVMLVTRAQIAVNVSLDPAPFSDDDNRKLLRAEGIGRLLPEVADFIAGTDTQPRVDKAVACENTYAPSRSDGHNILLIHGFDLHDPGAPLRSTGVVAGFSSVYASTSSLYLASTEISDGGYFTPDVATTRVHKLDAFGDDGAAVYKATGVFLGQIKDELSLDEGPDGSLRMVITDNSESADVQKQTTSLLVVKENGTHLEEASRVADIGRGENVESVRFLGDRAYVVSYPAQQFLFFEPSGVPALPFTDPLTIIDLGDPASPRVRGQLEVNGYAAYIHPIDDGHILTVGVNTDADTGLLQSLSLKLFDVSDPDHPALAADPLDFGNAFTDSEALVDRHAFTYFPDKQILAIPVQQWGGTNALVSSSLAVFHVDVDGGIEKRGRLSRPSSSPAPPTSTAARARARR